MLLGTHTSGTEPNYLLIATATLPTTSEAIDVSKYEDEKGELTGYNGGISKIDIVQKIPHDGEINRARYMPQNPNIIATKTITGDVYIFDLDKQREKNNVILSNSYTGTKSKNSYNNNPLATLPTCSPDIICKGHKKEGYGLSWSKCDKGKLISSSEDASICYWDIESALSSNSKHCPAMYIYRDNRTDYNHTSYVEDVGFSPFHVDLFGSCGDDKKLLIWDARQAKVATANLNAHDAEINTLSWSNSNEYYLITGSSDKTLKLWDTRLMSRQLHIFEGHSDEIYKVEFAPFGDSIFASSGNDRRLLLWDLSKIGDEQSNEDAEDGPPELLFIHAGHTNRIADFTWNEDDPWVIASVADDNVCQIWQMASSLYKEDYFDIDSVKSADLED